MVDMGDVDKGALDLQLLISVAGLEVKTERGHAGFDAADGASLLLSYSSCFICLDIPIRWVRPKPPNS